MSENRGEMEHRQPRNPWASTQGRFRVNPDKIWPDPDGTIMERYRRQYEGMDI